MRQIYLFSEIDSWVSESIIRRLTEFDRESSEEITLIINSPGGRVIDAISIIDAIKIIKSPVRTICIGQACSAAAVILSAGSPERRFVTPASRVMIHEVSAGTYGNLSEMRESIENISALNEIMASMLAKNTKKTVEEIKSAWNKTDKYFTAQEAVSFGLADKIIDAGEAQSLKLSDGINVQGFEISEINNKEIQILREGHYVHPVYGEISISVSALESMKKNLENNVRGCDVSIDYTHDNDNGEAPAAFWIRSLEIKNNFDGKGKGLFAYGEFTPKGAKAVSEKEYRYASADFVIDYVAQDGKHYPYVLRGGTLTNRPFIKNMNPIKLSEKKEINFMEKDVLIVGLKAHGIDVTDMISQVEQASSKIKDLENKISELNKLPMAKEEEIAVLKTKLSEASAKIVSEAKDRAFDSIVTDGKAVPAQKSTVMNAFKSADEILAFFKDSPKIVSNAPSGDKGNHGGDLSDEEQKLVDAGMYTKEEIISGRYPVKR